MKKNKSATSIVEAIVVTLIIAIGLVGVYQLYTNSIKFLNGIEAKIGAVQIAREGIESVENIRDTNWLLFSSDKKNCWNVVNYDGRCIGGGSSHESMNGNYIIYRENDKGRWLLKKSIGPLGIDYKNQNYKDFYKVNLNNKGFYTQVGRNISNTYIDKRKYTRRIEIIPKVDLKSVNGNEVNSPNGMLVKSIVEWTDMASSQPRKVELVNVLTNYKK